jgi:hypothetical protein
MTGPGRSPDRPVSTQYRSGKKEQNLIYGTPQANRPTNRRAGDGLGLGKTEGRSKRQISGMTGIPPSTVEAYSRGPVAGARSPRETYSSATASNKTKPWNKPLVAWRLNRTNMPRRSCLKRATIKPSMAVSILIDKARLLAGESTQNVDHLHRVTLNRSTSYRLSSTRA